MSRNYWGSTDTHGISVGGGGVSAILGILGGGAQPTFERILEGSS